MYAAAQVSELIRPLLKGTTIDKAFAHSEQAGALTRRLYAILNGKSEEVQDQTADQLFTALGRPDLYQYLTSL